MKIIGACLLILGALYVAWRYARFQREWNEFQAWKAKDPSLRG